MSKQDELYQTLLNALEHLDAAAVLATIDKINPATVALVVQNLDIEQQVRILEIIPQEAWDAVTIDGKIFAIPEK